MSFGFGLGFPKNAATLGAAGGPSLSLNFIGVDSISPAITFTRASSATYFDSTGTLQTASNDVARLDYSPSTLAPRGLLIEEQRTNICLQSEDFATTWAAVRASVSANATTAPSGATTADKLVEDSTASNNHALTQSISWTNGTSYSYSVYAKASERTEVLLLVGGGAFSDATARNAYFKLSDGTVISNTAGITATITAAKDGWYRCVISFTASATASANITLQLSVSGSNSYTGNGTSGIFLWGAQLEAGAFATSYIPTTTASATRNADAASMTGTNFSSWYNATEGALFAEASPLIAPLLSPGRPVFFLTNGTTSSIDIRFRPTQKAGMAVIDAGSTQVDSASTGNYSTSINKLAGAYLVNNFASTLNAESPVADTSGTVPSGLSSAFIASDGTNRFNGYIRRLAYYPRRLANAELQSITS